MPFEWDVNRTENPPEEYALTKKESAQVYKASNTLNASIRDLIGYDTQRGKMVYSVTPETKEQILAVWKKNRVSLPNVAELARRVLGAPWYVVTFAPVNGRYQEDETGAALSVFTSDSFENGEPAALIRGGKLIKAPGGRRGRKVESHQDIKDTLKIPPEYRYITPGEFSALLSIVALADAMGIQTPTAYNHSPKEGKVALSKVSQKLGALTFGQRVEVEVARGGKKKEPVYAPVILVWKGEARPPAAALDAYDRAVINAVATLYKSSPTGTMTAAEIFRAITGDNTGGKPNPRQLQDVRDSMSKLRFTEITIDARAQNELYGIQAEAILKKNAIYAEEGRFRVNGTETTAYKILAEPVLHTYAAAYKQIRTVPQEVKRISPVDPKTGQPREGAAISNTRKNICLKEILLHYVLALQGRNFRGNGLKWETIFLEMGLEATSRTEAARIRDTARAILEYWRAIGFIDSFSFVQEKGREHKLVVHTSRAQLPPGQK